MELHDHTLYVSLDDALAVVTETCRELGLSPGQRSVMEAYVHGIEPEDDGTLRLDRINGLLDNLIQALRSNDSSFLEERRGFRFDHIPDVIEFVESRDYGDQRSAWKSTKENLWQTFHEPTELGSPPCIIVLGGAGGTGKSETSKLVMMYSAFLLGSMWNPHLEFGQNPDSDILLVVQAIKKDTADESVFNKVIRGIDRSPWFKQHFPRFTDINSEIRFQNSAIKIKTLTGNHLAGKGKDVFGFVLGEVNAAPVHEHSKRLQNLNKDKLDVGREMYDVLIERVESRFSRSDGGFPGKGVIDSQREHLGDFTDQMKRRAERNPNIRIIEKTLWQAKEHAYPKDKDGNFIEGHFLLECGDDTRPSRIIKSVDEAIDPTAVIRIPNRHLQTFYDDIEEAAKHLVGVPTSATGRFISDPRKITLAQTKFVGMFGDSKLFRVETLDFREMFGDIPEGEPVNWDLLINQEFIDNLLDKAIPCSLHLDMAVSGDGDAMGLGITRIIGTKNVRHGHEYCSVEGKLVELENYNAPVYCTIAKLRIKAAPGQQIDLNLTRDLGSELRRRGLYIKYMSADWMEATAILQAWNRESGVVADAISVDRTPHAYYELRQAIMGERYVCQPHEVADTELRGLVRKQSGDKVKIDHKPGGSKDVADGEAGAVWTQRNMEGNYEEVEDESRLEKNEKKRNKGRDKPDPDDEFTPPNSAYRNTPRRRHWM